MISVAVIGGGASGMAFAVALKQKRPDIEVAVFEKNPKVLKKMLVTGNGRCNILNFDAVAENYFEACEFVRPAVEKYAPKKTEAIFRDMGLLLMSEQEGRAFELFKALGIRVTELSPALTGMCVKDMPFSLKGLRQYCKCTVFSNEKEYVESGEVQFNDYGLSGIPIMQLSRFIGKSKATATLDCLPSLTKNEITAFLQSHKFREPSGDVLCGILPRALANFVLRECNVKKDEPFASLSSDKTLQIASVIKSLKFSVTGVRGFDFAQVTHGGAALSEFDNNTLEAKKVKHLYAVGEALNVDGPCGGYNLGWAWSSAFLAAESVLKEL